MSEPRIGVPQHSAVTIGTQAETPDPANALAELDQNPYLFAVGCPRSGTTLLQRMLDAHSQLAVANDSHFIPRVLEKTAPEWMERARRGEAVPLTEELVQGAWDYHRFYRLGLDWGEVRQAGTVAETYQQFVHNIYASFANHHGCRWSGEKTPDYVRHLDLLHGQFPKARVLHIYRDGRDVALSLQGWAHKQKGPGRLDLWDHEPVGTCALWWRWLLESGRRSASTLPQLPYLEVCYEQLAAAPVDVLPVVTEFLDIEFESAMADFHRGKTVAQPGLSAKSAWQPATPGLRDWRAQMPDDDVALFECLAGDTLEAFGYERSGRRPSPQIERRAEQCRQWWMETGPSTG